jgi:hypothetical protein
MCAFDGAVVAALVWQLDLQLPMQLVPITTDVVSLVICDKDVGCWLVDLMVFNATFNNISAISWRSVLLVEETGGPRENHRPVARFSSHY